MTTYSCFECSKDVGEEFLRKRVRCPHCGSKIIYKPRIKAAIVKAL